MLLVSSTVCKYVESACEVRVCVLCARCGDFNVVATQATHALFVSLTANGK